MESKYNKMVLAIPRASTGRNYSENAYLPYGSLKLLSYAKQKLPDVDFRLLSGSHHDSEESLVDAILQENPDIVGISTHTTLSYPNCLDVYHKLLEKGVPCVFGGLHSSYVPEMVVQNQGVDVIRGQAYEGLVAYLTEIDKSKVPDLVWKSPQGNIIHNDRSSPIRYDTLPSINSTLFDIDDFWKGFQENHVGTTPFDEKCFTIFTHEGCVWRDATKGGCTFCQIPQSLYHPNPTNIWNELGKVVEEYGRGIFFKDYGDCLSGDWEYVKALAETRPKHLKPFEDFVLEPYLKTNELRTQEQMDLLKSIGISRAYVGYESFSNEILKKMMKGASTGSHWKATKLLISNGIYILAGCVLGCEGENKKSLQETVNGFTQLRDFCGDNLLLIGASPVAVLPGAPMYKQLIEKEPRHGKTDEVDFVATRRDWLRHFTNLGEPEQAEQTLIETSKDLGNLCRLKNYYGFDK